MPEKKEKLLPYKVTLALKNGKTYKGEGETLLEAMGQIEVQELIKSLGTIFVSYKDKKIERVCNALRLQKIFGVAVKKHYKETALITYSKFLNSAFI